MWLLCLWSLLLLSACQQQTESYTDRLNSISYAYHYRSLDSTKVYADSALASARNYDAGMAEALNNLVFVDIAKMNYKSANHRLSEIYNITDNQVELLIADIQNMRLCQRESRNKEFYDYHEQAIHRLTRIGEEQETLSDHQRDRLVYASSELDIVTSTYYYYVGLEQPSARAIMHINPDGEVRKDTAQLIVYYYNIGAGGIITTGTQTEINQTEFDYLVRCYMLAREHGYSYWMANSLQAMSEHVQVKKYRDQLMQDNLPVMKFINIDNMPDSLLAGNLAQRSLDIFKAYGDVYQIAGSYRTLAQCYWQIKDYNSAILCLNKALHDNQAINQAADLVASIREQLSVVYSAINDKRNSDYNRNIYLDLQEKTRQDRYLEARADKLDKSSAQLNMMITAVVLMIVIVVILLLLFDYLRRRSDRKNPLHALLEPLQEWQEESITRQQQLEEKYDTIHEAISLNEVHIVNNKKLNLEQRAKISLVNSITPFIDRILNEVKRLESANESDAVRKERFAYISELTDKINEYNSILTQWIRLRQGDLSLHIESFRLQDLFDVLSKNAMSYQLKGITLDIKPTDSVVKADKILTLFMLNTIADNARKFTNTGGTVTVYSVSTDKFVEISVHDTGIGIDEDKLLHLFDRKPILDESNITVAQQSHGFGLMNCRGIIDKYKKISQIFSVCDISAESEKGKGTRVFFRLPKGIARAFVSLCLLSCFGISNANHLDRANIFADSAYYSNIKGTYQKTLMFADSSMYYLNRFYREKHPHGKLLMRAEGNMSAVPNEIKWLHSGLNTNYSVILDIRNESAVAALALHRWNIYRYNNKVYTQLFKEMSADNTLAEYCRVMQKSEQNKNVAIIILVLLLLSIFPAYYFMYYRHRLYYRFYIERVKRINGILLSDASAADKLKSIQPIATDRFPDKLKDIVGQIIHALQQSIDNDAVSQNNIELAEDERRRAQFEDDKLHISNSVLDNCLSTLKHETMYYPSRIKQLVDDNTDHLEYISELASYYKDLYTMLSSQAMRQVESVKLVCKPFLISEINSEINAAGGLMLLGDKDLIAYIFEILQKQNNRILPQISVTVVDDRYLSFDIMMTELHISDEKASELFNPAIDHIPYLLCRQIARDNGESTNHRGCGIMAMNTDGVTHIILTLTKAK